MYQQSHSQLRGSTRVARNIRCCSQRRSTEYALQQLREYSNTLERKPIPRPFLRLVTWNILALGLQNAKQHLRWSERLPQIVSEISKTQADVVCLQEVLYFRDIANHLAIHGYVGMFFNQIDPERHDQLIEELGGEMGQAIFWKVGRVDMGEIKFEKFVAMTQSKNPTGSEDFQGHILAVFDFATHQGCRQVILSTSHMKAFSCMDFVRQVQVEQMLSQLRGKQNLMLAKAMPGDRPPAVMLCGDLNTSLHSRTSAIIRAHPLGLETAWDTLQESSIAQPELARRNQEATIGWRSTDLLDYIWYQGARLVNFPKPRVPSETGFQRIPCEQFPSDHVPIVNDLDMFSVKTLDGPVTIAGEGADPSLIPKLEGHVDGMGLPSKPRFGIAMQQNPRPAT